MKQRFLYTSYLISKKVILENIKFIKNLMTFFVNWVGKEWLLNTNQEIFLRILLSLPKYDEIWRAALKEFNIFFYSAWISPKMQQFFNEKKVFVQLRWAIFQQQQQLQQRGVKVKFDWFFKRCFVIRRWWLLILMLAHNAEKYGKKYNNLDIFNCLCL